MNWQIPPVILFCFMMAFPNIKEDKSFIRKDSFKIWLLFQSVTYKLGISKFAAQSQISVNFLTYFEIDFIV